MACLRTVLLVGCALFLAACGISVPDPQDPPGRLSDWGILRKEGDWLHLEAGTFTYSLTTPLFSDYAEKLRTVSMPEGERARQGQDSHAVFEFPVGTIISKTFFYWTEDGSLVAHETPFIAEGLEALDTRHARLIETRLLVRAASGWVAVPYVWNDAQDEAYLSITGDLVDFEVRTPHGGVEPASYLIPSRSQCASCHARRNSGGIHPIGPKAWNVDMDFLRNSNHLLTEESERESVKMGHLAPLARRYLDVNCAHCHSDEGAGDTSGLFLEISETDPIRLGVCKRTIAAGQGTGGRTYDIVPGDAEASILIYRMKTSNAAEMMPELGRSLVHSAGVSLIADWIRGMPETCADTLDTPVASDLL